MRHQQTVLVLPGCGSKKIEKRGLHITVKMARGEEPLEEPIPARDLCWKDCQSGTIVGNFPYEFCMQIDAVDKVAMHRIALANLIMEKVEPMVGIYGYMPLCLGPGRKS